MVCFQPPSLLIGKVWVPVNAFFSMSHTLQCVLESGQEARILQIDFSAAVDSQPLGHSLLAMLCGC